MKQGIRWSADDLVMILYYGKKKKKKPWIFHAVLASFFISKLCCEALRAPVPRLESVLEAILSIVVRVRDHLKWVPTNPYDWWCATRSTDIEAFLSSFHHDLSVMARNDR